MEQTSQNPGRVTLEVREPARSPRRVVLDAAAEFGRDVADERHRLADAAVSRRHARLEPTAEGLLMTDLGSANGTMVDGSPVTTTAVVHAGSVLRLGDTMIAVVGVETNDDRTAATESPRPEAPSPDEPAQSGSAAPPQPPPDPAAPPPPAVPPPAPEPAELTPAAAPEQRPDPSRGSRQRRPELRELEAIENEAVIVRFRPGTPGAENARWVAERAVKARAALAGVGSEPWGVKPDLCLVDPFPSADRPGEVVTDGTVVDDARNEIWMVVTAESPPEDPARPLALLFGSQLPAFDELAPIIEGYGMVAAGIDDPADQLRGLDLPPLEDAAGELRAAMATSFVHNLLEREAEDVFRRLLGTSRPGSVDSTAQELYGLGLVQLEASWHENLAQGEERVPTGQFLRLSLTYLRKHIRRQAEIFVYMLAGLAFTMVFPFVSKRLFDIAIPSGEFSQVVSLLTALAIAFVVSLLAGLRRAYLSAHVSSSVVKDIRQQMFDRLQRLDTGWYQRYEQGDVLSRMFSDVMLVQQGLSETLSQGVFQLLSLVVAAAIMLQLDPLLGGIVLLGAPLVAVVYRAMGGGAYKRSLAVQEQSSQLLSITGENYAAEPVVKMFSLGGRERERFARSAERLFRRQLSLMLYGGIFGLSVNMIVTFLRLFVLGFGSWLILEGRFTIGGLVAFLGIMGEVISPVTVLTNIGQELQASTGALVRINAILDSEPEVDDPPDGVELPRLSGEIRLAGVGFSYDGTNRTLDGLDLTISAGSKVAFVGPSGSGKSTVLRLLMRLYDPDEGAVLFDGVDLRQASMSSHRDQLGVVFQESFLFSTTVRENIALGRPGASEAEVREAAIQAEVDDFIERLPRSYDTLVGERGALLSGGQRQRVSIARALIRDPAVLLLDEATSALDPRTERQINDTLDRVGAGRTTISVTHRLTSVVDYDRIFVLVDGTLAEQGNHDELVAAGGVYAHLWSEQTGESVVEAPEFGSADMLRRVPIFADLDADGLEWVARRLRVSSVPAGTVVPEEGGRLVFVAGGRAEVHAPGLRGGDTKLAGLGPGDVFGLSALLGHDRDAELRVVVDSQLAVLADTDVRATADRYAVVAEALRGVRPATAGPVGGRRLSRSTFVGKVPDDRWREPQTALARTAEVEREVRRASGVYERLTP